MDNNRSRRPVVIVETKKKLHGFFLDGSKRTDLKAFMDKKAFALELLRMDGIVVPKQLYKDLGGWLPPKFQ